MTPAVQLLDSLSVLRRQWRARVLLESAVWIAAAALLAVFAGMLIAAAFGPTTGSLLVARGVGYSLIAAVIARFLVAPLVRRASDERFALYVEERAPELRQALLSAVHELRLPEEKRASPSLTARLVERTLILVRPLHRGAKLERPRMLRAGRWLGLIAVASALLLVVGPAALRNTARQLFAPWSVAEAAVTRLAVSVRPGNAAIPRGAAVDIRARLIGFGAEGAELVFRADTGTQWIRLPMARDAAAGAFTSRVFDLTRPTEYYVESNGVASPVYTLTITQLPAVKRLAMDLHYPAYTGLPTEHVDDGGDVAAVIGTTVILRPSITLAVRGGALVFDDGETVPFQLAKDGSISASFRVTKTRYYRIDLVSQGGAIVPGSVQYAIDAIRDHPPSVRIDEPGRDTKVTNIEEVTIGMSASDDYGVEAMELRYRVNGGEEKRVALADSGQRHPKELRVAHTLFLEEMKLKPGDLITYNAIARDGAGNVGSSDVYFLEVRPFGKTYRQSEQQGGGGGGGGGDSPSGFVARQREVVAGTFNWLRDSATTVERKRREDITTVDIAEGRLREEVASLSARIVGRNAVLADTNFRQIKIELDSAVVAMVAAEERLVKAQGNAALPPEQQALQHLQAAEALYRDVQVQIGGQSGGGGGGRAQQKAEDLADLFELQTDKLKNQYEALPQQSQQQQAQQAVDETIERLKQLAARQQQENERLQRMAEAMREKLGREAGSGGGGGGGGGGGSQRELAKEAEDQARRLERLAREQNDKDMLDAAQKMQQAANAMKRAAATGSAAQGSAAADQLKNAASGLENAQSSRARDAVRRLAAQAKDLEDKQNEISNDVKSWGNGTPDQRGAQLPKLNQEKDALKSGVARLEAEADRVSRESRRDQPAASGKLGEAANAIRDQRVRDKIDFSKNVLRGGSSDYANAFEGQIAANLRDIADKMRAAAGSLSSESASRGQERSLEQTRELVKGLESLRDRTSDRSGAQTRGQQSKGQGQQSPAQQGQQGQQGQAGGQRGQGQSQGEGGSGRSAGGSREGTPNGTFTREDVRQFSREAALRRQAAEELRNSLKAKGMDVSELDKAIEDLRSLESGAAFVDPHKAALLQEQMIEGLKTFEFALYRRFGLGDDKSPTLGSNAPVPAEYRAAVEEYYRSLAGGKRKP